MSRREVLRVPGGELVTYGDFTDLERAVVTMPDGAPLSVYYSGNSRDPGVLLVPPIGVPAPALSQFIRALAPGRFVVTWDTRGYPSMNDNFADTNSSLDSHVADALYLRSHYAMRASCILGYCTGGMVALAACRREPGLFGRVVAVSSRLNLKAASPANQFTRTGEMLFPRMARSPAAAAQAGKMMSEMLASGGFGQLFAGVERPDELRAMVNGVYDDAQATYRYACMQRDIYGEDVGEWISEIPEPVLFVTAKDDTIVPPEWSIAAARMCQNSICHLVENGGHWAINGNPEIASVIDEYLSFAHNE